MPKYLLQLRKTSFFLIFRNSVISFGSNKASSKVEGRSNVSPNALVEIPEWCIISQRLTAEHGCWEPSLRLWRLSIYPFHASLWHMANFLLLRNSLSLVFMSRMRSPGLHHIFTFLLSFPLRISRFKPRRQRWLRRRERRFGRRKRKFRLGGLPQCTSSGLIFYQFHQTPLGLPHNAHFIWYTLGRWWLVEYFKFVRRVC